MNFEKNINAIEKKIGYTFKDKSLLQQAFTRTSWCNENKSKRDQSNEVLEFFGDSVLSAAIVTLLMQSLSERYEHGISTELGEGDFSNIKSKLSDKKNLSLATKALGLQEFLLMGEGDKKLRVENEPSVMEDLFESIIGAIYIDSGELAPVISSISKMLDVNEYMEAKAAPLQSHKNALQEWCADKKHRREVPVYKTVSETGPDHKKIYERACYIGGKVYGIGQGKNQKLADSAAAEEALKALIEEYEREISFAAQEKAAAAVQSLKEYAAKNKKPSAEFRDLGEVSTNQKGKEYEIECRFSGISTRASAADKRSAKALAAEKMLALLTEPQKKTKEAKKTVPVSKKEGSTPTKKSKRIFNSAKKAASKNNSK